MSSGMAADLRSCTSALLGSTGELLTACGSGVTARLARSEGDVAQRDFDRRPHALLIGRQVQPLLDAGDLRVVEHVARPVGWR